MSNAIGLNGQWLGRFESTTPGSVVVNADELESTYEGVAFLSNDDPDLPGTAAGFSVPGKNHTFEVRTNYILPLDPKSLQVVPLDQVQPRFGSFSKSAEIKGVLDGDDFQLSWKTDIGIEGSCKV